MGQQSADVHRATSEINSRNQPIAIVGDVKDVFLSHAVTACPSRPNVSKRSPIRSLSSAVPGVQRGSRVGVQPDTTHNRLVANDVHLYAKFSYCEPKRNTENLLQRAVRGRKARNSSSESRPVYKAMPSAA